MADAKAQSEPVSSMMGSASGISRQVFSAWASGTEATLRATLDAQKAALDASVSVAGAAVESEREALKQIAEAAKSAQEAALEAFRASVRAVEQATEGKTARPGR
jgi:hypothetical protein